MRLTTAGKFQLIHDLLYVAILDENGDPTGEYEESGVITKEEALEMLNGSE